MNGGIFFEYTFLAAILGVCLFLAARHFRRAFSPDCADACGGCASADGCVKPEKVYQEPI